MNNGSHHLGEDWRLLAIKSRHLELPPLSWTLWLFHDRDALGEPGQLPLHNAIIAGNFILNAYDAFYGSPTDPKPRVNLPPGFDLVADITMEDFVFRPGNPGEREFYGFVAHETNTDHYFMAIRGTVGLREWWDNFHVLLVPYRETACTGHVAYGFSAIYRTLKVSYVDDEIERNYARSLTPNMPSQASDNERLVTLNSDGFAKRIADMVRIHQAHRRNSQNPTLSPMKAGDVDVAQTDIVITGHSLGAALATLFVMQNASDVHAKLPPRSIITFASPRVGDADFASRFNELNVEKWRIYNEPDLVPKVPLGIEGFAHVDKSYAIDTRAIDDIKWTIPCWHDMNSYLAALGKPMPVSYTCHVADMPSFLHEARELARRALGI